MRAARMDGSNASPGFAGMPVPSSGQRADWWSTARIVDQAGRHKAQRLDIISAYPARPPDGSRRGRAEEGRTRSALTSWVLGPGSGGILWRRGGVATMKQRSTTV